MSLLTSYRPNFCSECGAKIVRLRWRLWTSRRFCDKCFARFLKTEWLRGGLAIAGFVLLGLLLGRGCRHEPTPLVIQRPVAATSPASTGSSPAPAASAQLYTCGARTKKGTPCSRRVHGPVRCWQHKGATAMLPAEKLLIKD